MVAGPCAAGVVKEIAAGVVKETAAAAVNTAVVYGSVDLAGAVVEAFVDVEEFVVAELPVRLLAVAAASAVAEAFAVA